MKFALARTVKKMPLLFVKVTRLLYGLILQSFAKLEKLN